MPNSKPVGPSEASLLLFYAKSMATMETVLPAHFAHAFPGGLIIHSEKKASNTPCVPTLERKRLQLLLTTFPAVFKREKGQSMCYAFYWVHIAETKRRHWNSERLFATRHYFPLKWWVFYLLHLKVLFGVTSRSELQRCFSFPSRWMRQWTVYNNTERGGISIERYAAPLSHFPSWRWFMVGNRSQREGCQEREGKGK